MSVSVQGQTGWASIPNNIGRSRLPHPTVHLLLNLLTHSDGFNASYALITRQTGMAPETISTALGNLKKLGLVTVEKRAGENGRFASNHYVFHADRLWQLTPELVNERLGRGKKARATATGDVVGSGGTATGDVVGTATGDVAAPLRETYRKKEQEETPSENDQPPFIPPGGSVADAPPTQGQDEVVSAELVPMADAAPEPKPKQASRGTRLQEGWYPDLGTVNRIREQFPTITKEYLRAEHLKFTDYWLSKAGAAARKVDWNRTWANWIRTAMERSAPRQASSSVVNAGTAYEHDWRQPPPPRTNPDGKPTYTWLSDLEG